MRAVQSTIASLLACFALLTLGFGYTVILDMIQAIRDPDSFRFGSDAFADKALASENMLEYLSFSAYLLFACAWLSGFAASITLILWRKRCGLRELFNGERYGK